MRLEGLIKYFAKLEKRLSKNIVLIVEALMKSVSANTAQIALALGELEKKNYKASDMQIYRLLSNDKFKVGKVMFRGYIKLIFEQIRERTQLKKGDRVYIQVDFTSERDNFLILMASILISDKAIPLYFSMRNYPKKKGQYSQKKMEAAFIQALRSYLSRQYRYVLLADRGFGNDRFITLCETFDFDYIIRVEPNLKISYQARTGIMSTILNRNGKFSVEILAWNKTVTLVRNKIKKSVWFIVTNLTLVNQQQGIDGYARRFAIEKFFQDLKSSGFNLEHSKIRDYARFKRLLFLCCFAYSLLFLLGDVVAEKYPELKKKLTSPYKPVYSLFQLAKRLITFYEKLAFRILYDFFQCLILSVGE